MKKLAFIFVFLIGRLFAQEPVWDQGVPLFPENDYISNLMQKIDFTQVRDSKNLSDTARAMCRDIGLAFYDAGFKDEADWYLTRSKDFHFEGKSHTIKLEDKKEEEKKEKVSVEEMQNLQQDLKFLESMPKSFDDLPKKDLKNLAEQIERRLRVLTLERDSILNTVNPNQTVIAAKENTINALKKDKKIINLTIESQELKSETKGLKIKTLGLEVEASTLKKYLIISSIVLSILILALLVVSQRKRIKIQDVELEKQLGDIAKKNTYLEHAAKVIRHDMHSGINTYIPRGLSSLEKRINDEVAKELKIDLALRMIKEGLSHTQKAYKNVYEFTNLVKPQANLTKTEVNLGESLTSYLSMTSYSSQVQISDLPTVFANETLLCIAIDNLIRNGLKYNDSSHKQVKVFAEGNFLYVEDNGRGMSQEEFEQWSNPKKEKKEESGLGLNICKAILEEHGFKISAEKLKLGGTKLKIKLKKIISPEVINNKNNPDGHD